MRSQLKILEPSPSRHVFRLVVGWQQRLGSRDVAVVCVWSTWRDGLVAEVTVHDPLTREISCTRVGVDDALLVGAKRYVVLRVVQNQGVARGWIELARMGHVWLEE